MAKCPKCNNQLPIWGMQKIAVETKSGRRIYRACPNCQAILKTKFNKNLNIALFFPILAYGLYAEYKFPYVSHSSIFSYLYLILFGIVFVSLVLYFTEYEVIDDQVNDKQLEDSKKVQFLEYFRESGWVLLFIVVITVGFIMGGFKSFNHKDIIQLILVGAFLVGLMFLGVYVRRKIKEKE